MVNYKKIQLVPFLEHTADDGKKYKTTFYSLDVIIAVGYRVNSNKATFVVQNPAHFIH
ncbi:MAG: RhuM family protein [Cytophagaceae bacterium]